MVKIVDLREDKYLSDAKKDFRSLSKNPPFKIGKEVFDFKIGDTVFNVNDNKFFIENYGRFQAKARKEIVESQGLRLVQFWSDEVEEKFEIVEKTISHLTQTISQDRIFARKCVVKEISLEESNIFLEKFHIQGKGQSRVKLGLFLHDELVAVMLLKTRRRYNNKKMIKYDWELTRYATKVHVVGGHSKLLSFFVRNYHPISVCTFSDLCISQGNLYKKTGFSLDKFIKPDYRYWRDDFVKRQHKFNFRIQNFQKSSNLTWEKGLSELELSRLNNIYRIWDAGKEKWIIKYEF